MTLPCLVLIPGPLCDGRIFARQIGALRAVARVIVVDYAALKNSAMWINKLLKTLPERFSVAGFFLGGLWALALIQAAPDRVERLALIASNAEAASPRGKRRNAVLWQLWRACGPGAVVRAVKPGYFHYALLRTKHAALLREMAQVTHSRAARAQFCWAASRGCTLHVLTTFPRPVLIVSGARDNLCPRLWQQRMVDAQPAAKWQELERCGHLLPLEAPTKLRVLMLNWLK